MTLWNSENGLPLKHLRVIDCTVMLPGPLITRILAQYGAEVIKIEALPDGDPLRALPQSDLVTFLNQGKKSVGVDLKNPKGVELVKRLVAEADVFLENFREGVLEKMGLGYAALSEVNADLLYLSIRGLGGKDTALAAHDINFIAHSGVGEWFLESGVPNASTQFGDLIGGAYLPALQLMLQLANPHRAGSHLVCHMDECFRALYLPRAYDAFKAERLESPASKQFGAFRQLDGSQPHSRFYKCRDGFWVSLNAIQPKHWRAFCESIDRAEWVDRLNDPSLVPEVEKIIADAPSTYWESLTAQREFCLFRVIPWQEHLMGTQARTQLALDPLHWAGFAPNDALLPPPVVGSHTRSVLHSVGVTEAEVQKLTEAGIIRPSEGK